MPLTKISRPNARRRTMLTLTAAAGALLLALSACAAEPEPAEGTPPASSEQAQMADWQAKLSNCLTAQGIDPNVPVENSSSQAAYTKCYSEIGPPPVTQGGPPRVSEKESLEMDLALAKCMREAGYDYPDPDPNRGDTSSGEAVNPGDFDRETLKKCMSVAYGDGVLDGFGTSE